MRIDYKEQAGIAMSARTQLADSVSDRQVTLGALAFADELGAILWRMKYGQDVKRAGMRRATLLLASKVRSSGKFNRARFTGIDKAAKRERNLGGDVERSTADVVERFARRVIVEWVADVCVTCSGRGKVAVSVSAVPSPTPCGTCGETGRVLVDETFLPSVPLTRRYYIREYERCPTCHGRTRIYPDSRTREAVRTDVCPSCSGTGRARVDHPARAHALGVSLDVYRRRWEARFHGMLAILDQIDARAGDVVSAQMRRAPCSPKDLEIESVSSSAPRR